jgi:hypothetical protein
MSIDGRWDEDGFSLVEALVAAGILVTILAGLAQLIAWNVNHASRSDRRSRARVAVQDKLERLRAMAWTVDLGGVTVSDPDLALSPSSALDASTNGWVDEFQGVVRRWAIESVDSGVPDAIAITVCAFPPPALHLSRRGADVCLSTVRVRQP